MSDEKLVSISEELTKLNEISGSFDFLKNEPEIYSIEDCKK